MNDEYAALCKQIRTQMKRDFEEYKRWKKGKTLQENVESIQEDETSLEDFEREMEEEFLEENVGKEGATSLRKTEIEEHVETFQKERVVQQDTAKNKEGVKVEQRLVEKTENHLLNKLCTGEAPEKANTKTEQQRQEIIMSEERLQEAKASGGDIMKLKKMSNADGVLETLIGNEAEKMQSEETVQANNEKYVKKESVAEQSSSVGWKSRPRIKGRYGAWKDRSALSTVLSVSLT